MARVRVERLDHLGVIAGVIKELGIVELIDSRIDSDEQEAITTGEAISGMLLNGLGFSDRPMSLTPQFFQNKPLDVLFRPGVVASHFNRFKLGRSLDKVFAYGCDALFSEISLAVCRQAGVDLRFHSLDTTTFSLTGAYVPDSDESAIGIVRGYSKDHRPDLKQVVLETIVSQDGGIPLLCKSWDGNASDTKIFEARAADLITQFQDADAPRYLVADAKLYTKDNAANLSGLSFITRIPETIKTVGQVIKQAWEQDAWQVIDRALAYQSLILSHYGITQRWLIVYSKQAEKRAEKTMAKAQKREYDTIQKALFHLQAQRFNTQQDAQKALLSVAKKLKYHRIGHTQIQQHIRYAKKGRPTPETPIRDIRFQITADISPDKEKIQVIRQRKATFVIGTNIFDEHLSEKDIIQAYKGQRAVETGFRFLKDPHFFAASLFLKKPTRIQALLTVMTLALLVYAIAQRTMRACLSQQHDTLPNQIGQPTKRPTLRWLFQILDGIHRVTLHTHTKTDTMIEGLTDIRIKILRLFGTQVCQIYQIYHP